VDKFGGLDWSWDGDVPELAQTLVYSRRRMDWLMQPMR
jgi:hypothetical protein